MISTSGFLTALECTEFVFGWGSAPYPAGDITALPIPSSWFNWGVKEGIMEGGRGKELFLCIAYTSQFYTKNCQSHSQA